MTSLYTQSDPGLGGGGPSGMGMSSSLSSSSCFIASTLSGPGGGPSGMAMSSSDPSIDDDE